MFLIHSALMVWGFWAPPKSKQVLQTCPKVVQSKFYVFQLFNFGGQKLEFLPSDVVFLRLSVNSWFNSNTFSHQTCQKRPKIGDFREKIQIWSWILGILPNYLKMQKIPRMDFCGRMVNGSWPLSTPSYWPNRSPGSTNSSNYYFPSRTLCQIILEATFTGLGRIGSLVWYLCLFFWIFKLIRN